MDNHGIALQQTGFWGRQGSGAIIMAKTTGRLLIPFRSLSVEQPHTWGVWGGAVDSGENPKDAVKREMEEEVGYRHHDIILIPMYVFHDKKSGFKYHNFLAVVNDEFTPELNWETDNFKWVEFGDWPSPLHFGLKALIQHSGKDIKGVIDKNKRGERLDESDGNNKVVIQLLLEDLTPEIINASKDVIKRTWKLMPKEDRYDDYQFNMWALNDEDISNLLYTYGSMFYPNDSEPNYKFYKDVEEVLDELEEEKNQKMSKKIDKNDPLFLLKQIVKGKSWEGVKQSIERVLIGSWGYKGGKISDEIAERNFNRLYKNAMGETVYDEKYFKDSPRLSSLRRNVDDVNDYVNTFINYNLNFKFNQFPEKVLVYRGTNSPTHKIRPGDFVTFNKSYARDYSRGKFASVIRDTLPSKDLIVYKMEPYNSEMIYWPEGHQIKKVENIPTFKEFWEMYR